MEFRQLQTFMIIAQTESFSKAAELLGYSQSAVTVQIRLLEKELDTRLFERMGRKIALTAQGQNLQIHAGRILEEMSQAEAEIRLEQELCSPLHVGVIESLFFTKLPPILGYFRQHYPKVSLKLTTGTPKELIEHMEYNQLDLIYILDRPRYNNRWSKEMEKKEDIVFVTNPKLAITQKQDLMVEDLLYNPFFLTEKNENYRKELDQFLESKDIILTPSLESSNTEFIIRMIIENGGISYLPYFAVEKSIKSGELAVLKVKDFQLSMYQQIFYHKSKWKTKEMEEFIRLAQMNRS
ncbi:MAG: LysR family transcriptional regulator [Oribacterium sp.]|uniref:LysR family transcriptional regulator n=1 Tax=Oribacterium sp. HCP3S3_B9 TaxID=3438946 RepID=UPI00305E15F4|nr:LysR family transcriptional regulator [Oribacterium sp.]